MTTPYNLNLDPALSEQSLNKLDMREILKQRYLTGKTPGAGEINQYVEGTLENEIPRERFGKELSFQKESNLVNDEMGNKAIRLGEKYLRLARKDYELTQTREGIKALITIIAAALGGAAAAGAGGAAAGAGGAAGGAGAGAAGAGAAAGAGGAGGAVAGGAAAGGAAGSGGAAAASGAAGTGSVGASSAAQGFNWAQFVSNFSQGFNKFYGSYTGQTAGNSGFMNSPAGQALIQGGKAAFTNRNKNEYQNGKQ